MKIAVISNVSGYQWAGSEELWRAAAMRALSSGSAVTACLHQDLWQSPELDGFRASGGIVRSWKPCGIARFESLRQRVFPSFTARTLGHPEVILVSLGSLPAITFVPGLVGFLSQTAIPYVLLCQFNAECLPFTEPQRATVRRLCERAGKVVFVSEQNRRLAKRQLALELANSVVIPNPIRSGVGGFVDRAAADREEPVFGCVARMETLWKGQDLLLEILASDPWKSRPWKLRFFGSGPDEEHLRRCVKFYGLEARVEFSGYVRNPADLWGGVDLLVLPSRGEGMALVVLEAMICGRPVVVTDVGGVEELVEDGVNGFVAEVASVNSFGKAMERAWDARDDWQAMGEKACGRASEYARIDPDARLCSLVVSFGR
jgi:glycosyltransferase involved in cell wall biosynthesis